MDFKEMMIPHLEEMLSNVEGNLRKYQVVEYVKVDPEKVARARSLGISRLSSSTRKELRDRTDKEVQDGLDERRNQYEAVIAKVEQYDLAVFSPWSISELMVLAAYFAPDDRKFRQGLYDALRATYGKPDEDRNQWYSDIFRSVIEKVLRPLPSNLSDHDIEEAHAILDEKRHEWANIEADLAPILQDHLSRLPLVHIASQGDIVQAVSMTGIAYHALSSYLHMLQTQVTAGADGSFAASRVLRIVDHLKYQYGKDRSCRSIGDGKLRHHCLFQYGDDLLEIEVEALTGHKGSGVIRALAVRPDHPECIVDHFFHFHTPPQVVWEWLKVHLA